MYSLRFASCVMGLLLGNASTGAKTTDPNAVQHEHTCSWTRTMIDGVTSIGSGFGCNDRNHGARNADLKVRTI